MTKPDRYGAIPAIEAVRWSEQPSDERRAVKVGLRAAAPTRPADLRRFAGGPDQEGMFGGFAGMTPTISSVGVYLLRNCEVRGLAFAYLDGRLVDEPDLIPSYVRHDVDRGQQPQLNADLPVRKVEGLSVAFVSNAYQIYGHWLLDILPRLWIAIEIYGVNRAANFIIPNGTPRFAVEIIREYFGISTSVNFDLDRENLLLETAVIPSVPHNDHFFHSIMNEFVDWLLSHPKVISAMETRTKSPQLIYVTRRKFRGVSTSYVRSISNEEQVLELVKDLGFTVVSPEELPWSDQIALFSQARVIAGEDGSGLHNAIFSPAGTAVVCLNPANQVQVSITALRGQQITVLCSPEADGPRTEREIDLTRLCIALKAAKKSAGIPVTQEQIVRGDASQVGPYSLAIQSDHEKNQIRTKYSQSPSNTRHAVLLSSYVPDTDVGLAIGEYYLDMLSRNFADCTVYVGINTGSCERWRIMLAQSELDIVVCEVPQRLTVNSDVAGFQAVLRTLRATRAKHDYYWFGHTKGASHKKYEEAELLRWVIERDFWSRRNEIETNCDPMQYGAFPALPMPAAGPNTEVVAYLKRLFPTRYSPIGYISTNTFFGITGIALRNFLASVDSSFFERNLLDGTGISRYFFEGGFSWIGDMAGFEPYLLHKAYRIPFDAPALREPGHPNEFEQNQQRVAGMIEAWRLNRSNFDFQGWPVWVGDKVQLGTNLYDAADFFQRYPQYRST
ncbi:glycosyltransferase family 61 protein [Methylobacterium sp. J-090]|uniref:glycosyltransferase family 61 protein n=1 Tax=Methylobacterium sp. J-090 TaxID=2836666 RepID=UPI001FBBBAFE|nr:glycosyltransferase 61 family protein [Methylobacterium sp. J-090]MCJ2082335.1 glycosyltransferase family 61 protein [Methylobacterium sp. J-090]